MMAAYSEMKFIDDRELEKYNSKIKYLIDFLGLPT